MKEQSSSSKENDEFIVPTHRRTSSFSSIAKSYISKGTDKSRITTKLSKLSSNGSDNGMDDSKQLIAILEHQVNEGKKVRQEMADEIAKLKHQLQKAEAHISLLKHELQQRKGLSSTNSSPSQQRKLHDTDKSCASDDREYDEAESPFTKSCDSDMQWDFNPTTTSDPLNTSMYQGSIDEDEDSDSEFSINAIINTINMNNYNNIQQMQYNNINGISYIINNNNINNITNFNTTNNVHTINNINGGEVCSAPCTPRDKEKRTRVFSRTTTHHKRRGSDTEPHLKLEEKYQRRHSEGKVLRIAGIREQVKLTLRQLLATNHAEMEDEWPLIQVILQGMDISNVVDLPPPPRHLVHFGFVHEGEHEEEYWIDETLLLHFRNFLLVATQPKVDSIKKYVFKEILRLSSNTTVATWNTLSDHYGFSVATETWKRAFLNTTKEERDKWVAIISKQVSTIPAQEEECFQHYLISPCEGFVVEPTMVIPIGESKLALEEPKKGIYHYQSFFYTKPHLNYLGGTNEHPVALSIEDKSARFALSPSLLLRRSSTDASTGGGQTTNASGLPEQERVVHRVLVRTIAGDECVCVAVPVHLARSAQVAHAEIISQLSHSLHNHALPSHMKIGNSIFRVKSPDLETELLNYEATNMRRSHKIGVVYCPKGATSESEMLSAGHQIESADFRNFLALLGNEVTLKGWKDYNGGLDVKNDADGTHSVFTNFWGISIMFHVSTMLPNDPHNLIVAKKRHIGNDIVVIVFKEHDDNTLIVPSIFKSHLNHIFCVVQHINNPDGSVSYKTSFCSKEGIGGFTPPLPSPPVFAKDARFKHFLLAKIVNAERAALRSPPFAKRHALARNAFLKSLWKQFGVQPKIDDVHR